MLFDMVLLAVGFACIARGGDLFVDSSVHIGRVFRIPRFVIGGTLVSLATTMPELVVSATASTLGDSGIALGNAIGSCICNIGLIVGTVALITPVSVDQRDFANKATWMLAGAILVVAVEKSCGVFLEMDSLEMHRVRHFVHLDVKSPSDTEWLVIL